MCRCMAYILCFPQVAYSYLVSEKDKPLVNIIRLLLHAVFCNNLKTTLFEISETYNEHKIFVKTHLKKLWHYSIIHLKGSCYKILSSSTFFLLCTSSFIYLQHSINLHHLVYKRYTTKNDRNGKCNFMIPFCAKL